MVGNTNRRSWLEKLTGKEKADEVREDLQQAAGLLDTMGIERKDRDVEAALRPVAERIAEKAWAHFAVEGGARVEDEDLVVLILQSLMEEAEGVKELDEAEAGTGEISSDDEPAEADAVEEVEEAVEAGDDDVTAVVKGLADFIAAQTEDMGHLARVQTRIAEAQQKQGGDLAAIMSRLEAVEQIVASRPRQASKAGETLLPESDEAKQLAGEIKKGLEGEKIFLGVPVKDIPE